MGPGFLVSVAYVDPGNFDTDIRAGALFKYQLIWVLFVATLMGLLIQTLASRLGLVTGRHLSEHCRACYSTPVVYILWIMAEIAVIASDIPEVIGTAFALKLLFGLPLWIGVVVTCADTLLFLAIQMFGLRKLEAFIGLLLAIICVCFIIEMFLVSPSPLSIMLGFVPTVSSSSVYTAISLVGAVVMPHNIYLHSALVMSRNIDRTRVSINEGNKYNLIESSIALLLSFLINVAILTVSATEFSDATNKEDIGLDNASSLLKNLLKNGVVASIIFGIALLASGQSSTITGTFAGQFVMEGFLQLKIRAWLRNLVTRSVAVLPSLLVALIAGPEGSDELIVLSQVVLSLQLPFALIPLVKLTSSNLMGPWKNSVPVAALAWSLATGLVGANLALLIIQMKDWLSFGSAQQGIIAVLLITLALAYGLFIVYLVIQPVHPYTLVWLGHNSTTSPNHLGPDHDQVTPTQSGIEIEMSELPATVHYRSSASSTDLQNMDTTQPEVPKM